MKISIYQPELSGNEKKYVNECLDSNWISSRGKFVGEFETKFAEYVGIRHAVAVSNGTVALHLALAALGITVGDEVIVPTFTYIASVNAIMYVNATPVFVDSLKDTWEVDPEQIEAQITTRTKAIMVVHLYGHPCDMESIVMIARKHNLLIIEDCAEAFGAKIGNRHVGTFGDIAAYSFFGNKTITCGEGGMVITNNDFLCEKANHLKNQGVSVHKQYWHDTIGFNYRMTNICAAIGLAQLEQADKFIAKKRQIAMWYQEFLKDTPVTFHEESKGTTHSFWMCSVLVLKKEQRDELRKALELSGVETRPLFYPVHAMPMYSQFYRHYPVAEEIGGRGLNLPSYPALKKTDVQYICDIIQKFFESSGER